MDPKPTIAASEKASGAAACGRYAAVPGSTLAEIAEKVCKNVPRDHLILLCMERGAAWVELEKLGRRIKLPDSTDKTLVEQLNDALCMANGFIESNPKLTLDAHSASVRSEEAP